MLRSMATPAAPLVRNVNVVYLYVSDMERSVAFYRDLLGFEHLTIFPHLLGDSYKKADEQMARFAEEVVPLLS